MNLSLSLPMRSVTSEFQLCFYILDFLKKFRPFSLGMRHDTAENNCDPHLFIMSQTLGSGKTTWSSCSRDYLEKFLDSSQAQCMFDRGQFGNSLDHSAEGLLPGERFDADQQCMLKYGKESVRSKTQKFEDICRDLHCQRDRYTWTSHPALEGSYCGHSKVS